MTDLQNVFQFYISKNLRWIEMKDGDITNSCC